MSEQDMSTALVAIPESPEAVVSGSEPYRHISSPSAQPEFHSRSYRFQSPDYVRYVLGSQFDLATATSRC